MSMFPLELSFLRIENVAVRRENVGIEGETQGKGKRKTSRVQEIKRDKFEQSYKINNLLFLVKCFVLNLTSLN